MAKHMLAPVSRSADSHRAAGLASCNSAELHRAADVSPDTMVALLWQKGNEKGNKLRRDVRETFEHDTGIQIMLISEFGHN